MAMLTTLLSFNGTNGSNPYAGLIADAAGNLFGTTSSGGADGDGSVFELVNHGGAYTPTTLLSFNGVKNHVHSIFEKLQVHRRGEAAAWFRGGSWR